MRLDGGHMSSQENNLGEHMFHQGQGLSLHGKTYYRNNDFIDQSNADIERAEILKNTNTVNNEKIQIQ